MFTEAWYWDVALLTLCAAVVVLGYLGAKKSKKP
jgi:hypothetical protein